MKVLLKQLSTGRFLKDLDRWTNDPMEALDFHTTPSAMDYSRIHDYHNTSIVLKFADAQYDLEMTNG